MDEFLGTIKQFAFMFETQGWMICHGQTIGIAQNQALFALLGTQFGGDGQTNFKLPDLRKKDANGQYLRQGDLLPDGTPYIESYICVEGIFPSRQ